MATVLVDVSRNVGDWLQIQPLFRNGLREYFELQIRNLVFAFFVQNVRID